MNGRAVGLGWLPGIVLLGLTACAPEPPRPPPSVAPVSAQLRQLRVHVVNATQSRASEAGERLVTGYTIGVRGEVQDALVRAGYVVVVDAELPHDIELRINSDYQSVGSASGTLVTSLAVVAPGGMVDQLSAPIAVVRADMITADVAKMVDRLGASARLLRYAERLKRADVCPPSPPQIATAASAEELAEPEPHQPSE